MPKHNKTNKGLLKRLKITATGKVKYKRPGASHLMSGKSAKCRRRMRSRGIMNPLEAKKVKACL
jgi:large subunit ribosomal protein L35